MHLHYSEYVLYGQSSFNRDLNQFTYGDETTFYDSEIHPLTTPFQCLI